MILQAESLFKEIILKLCIVQLYIVNVSKSKLYDSNIIAENFFAKLFSIIYDKQFENLNKYNPNAKAVDIGDVKKETAMQITAENTKSKIKKSIEKFEKSSYFNKYQNFEIFIIASGKIPLSTNKYKVTNITNLIEKIKYFDNKKQKQINEFLDENLNIPILNIEKNTNLIKNKIIKPLNLNAYCKTYQLDLNDNERKRYLEDFYKYLNILNKIKSTELRIFLRLCAERMYECVDKKNLPSYISLPMLKEALPNNFKTKYRKLIKDLEEYKLVFVEYDYERRADFMYLENFGESNDWNITGDLIVFADKNNINPNVFFDDLDFSSLDK